MQKSPSGDAPQDQSAPPRPSHAATEEAPEARPLSGRNIRLALIAIAVLLTAAFVVGSIPRISTSRALAAIAKGDPVPVVEVMTVKRAPRSTTLSLPGTLEPLHQAAIYARTTGYIKQWSVDIGKAVNSGDVLAVIETPDLDQQLLQSSAMLEQAKATLQLANVEETRWAAMVKDSVVTVDEYDQKVQAARAAAAAVKAGEADVRRLETLQSFERVTAPFSGIITARNVDVGAFVQAGGGMSGSLPSNSSAAPTSLFQIAQTDTVRVYVTVPQSDAIAIEPGQTADVRVREFPNRVFTGRVVRTARAVDALSRTLLTEIQIINPQRILLPGMYAQIQFVFDRSTPPLVIPAAALLPLLTGIQVVQVDADQRVQHHTIKITRDYGAYVESDSGLVEGAVLVLNPGDALVDGMQVRPATTPTPSDTARGRQQRVEVASPPTGS
jgi:membrane fusion protein (multidrug efflux system)